MTRPVYRVLDHPADVYVEFCAPDMQALFVKAASVLFDLVAGEFDASTGSPIEVEAQGADREELLVRWLNEWVYIIDARGMVAGRIRVTELSDTIVRGCGSGVPVTDLPSAPGLEVKAVTFHGLSIESRTNGYTARVLFDV